MSTAQSILTELANHGATVAISGSNLRVEFKREPTAAIAPLLPELKKHKGEIIALLKSCPRTIDGHTVRRIIWQTGRAIIFEDSDGHFWRYLHAWNQAWPVIVGGR